MKKIIFILCTLYFILSTFPSSSQKQYNIWYFGSSGVFPDLAGPGAGLDFNESPPVALLNSAMSACPGSASYCNSAGQLLFYTNGDTVWNKNHLGMPNGNGLGGWGLQGSVIVPTTDTNIFYLFHAGGEGGNHGLFYSKINMEKIGGLGDVVPTEKKVLVGDTSDNRDYRLTATRHVNGTDYWVITFADSANNSFNAYQVSLSGVIKTVKSNMLLPVNHTVYSLSCFLKASPMGDRLATNIVSNNGSADSNYVILYDFDNATGKVSKPEILDKTDLDVIITGISFSPNGKLFYTAEGEFTPTDIFQFDLGTGSGSGAESYSKTHLGTGSISSGNTEVVTDLQIGPDCKIYTSCLGIGLLHTLDVINYPNIKGLGCGFVKGTISLGSRESWWALPNNILSTYVPYANIGNDVTLCEGSPVALNANAIRQTGSSYNWSNGANTYTINPTTSGIYWVDKTVGCVTVRDSVQITFLPSPIVDLGPDVTLCSGISKELDAGNPGSAYSWSTGENTKMIVVNTNATYSVSVTNTMGCIGADSIQIIKDDGKTLTIPNVFTPNNDGANDNFSVQFNGNDADFNVKIVDRWGLQLFNATGTTNDWDGQYNGKKVPAGVYYYIIDAVCSGSTLEKTGAVTINY